MNNVIPRRNRLDLLQPAEKAIRDAVQAVEGMDADARLTDAVSLLNQARESVADFIDGVPRLDPNRERDTERALREHAWSVIKRIGALVGWVDREDDAAWQDRIVGLVKARLEEKACCKCEAYREIMADQGARIASLTTTMDGVRESLQFRAKEIDRAIGTKA